MELSTLIENIALGFVSTLANFLSSFAGGGAGLVQLPALILFGLPFSIALATHKVASVALGLGAGIRHLRERNYSKYLSSILMIFGLPGVLIGTNIVMLIPDKIATLSLGLLTFSLGLYSSVKSDMGIQKLKFKRTPLNIFFGCFIIFVIGILNGSLSSGTGLFVTIWLVRWFKLTYTEAVGYTLIFVGFFWNGLGSLVLGIKSDVKWDWIPILIIGSLLGGFLGAHISLKKGSRIVKKAFEFICFILGLCLIFQGMITI